MDNEKRSFELDFGQMNQLYELLEKSIPREGSKDAEDHPLECLRAFRNNLHRALN